MITESIRRVVTLATLFLLAGCITGETSSTSGAGAAGDSCGSLTNSRRKLATQIDAVESGRAAPPTVTGFLATLAVLNGESPETMRKLGPEDRARAMAEMRARHENLDRQITERQCTSAARAGAGAIKATDSAQFDGVYAGNGTSDSWCNQPIMVLTVKSGRITGNVRADAKATDVYDVSGQLYDNGELSLDFRRPQSKYYTEDFDGSLKDGVLSFAAKLDPSPKACTYRFAVKKG